MLLAVLISLGATAVPTVHGQILPPAVRVGATVRLDAAGGDRVHGVLLSSDSGAVHLQTESGERAVPLGSVVALWERVPAVGRGARRGALVGGLVGSVPLLLNYAVCEYDCDREYALIGVAVGAGVGALLGAGWGAVRGRWVRRFP